MDFALQSLDILCQTVELTSGLKSWVSTTTSLPLSKDALHSHSKLLSYKHRCKIMSPINLV